MVTVPTVTTTAEEAAEALITWVFQRFGIPRVIISDRGPAWTSELMTALAACLGFKRQLTAGRSPTGNSPGELAVKRMRTLIRCHLEDVIADEWYAAKWAKLSGWLTFCSNTTQSTSHGYSPHYLASGWEPVLPVDLLFDTLPDYASAPYRNQDEYVQATANNLRKAWAIAKQSIIKTRTKAARYHNAKRRGNFTEYQVGDRVWLKFYGRADTSRGESAGLNVRWHGPFLITDRLGEPGQPARMYKLDTTANPRLSQWQAITELKPYKEPVGAEPADAADAADLPTQHLQMPPSLEDGTPLAAPAADEAADTTDDDEKSDDSEEHWEVEALLDARRRPRQSEPEVLVDWGPEYPSSWEPWSFLTADLQEEAAERWPDLKVTTRSTTRNQQ